MSDFLEGEIFGCLPLKKLFLAWILVVVRGHSVEELQHLTVCEREEGSSTIAAELISVLFQPHCSPNRLVPHLVLRTSQKLWLMNLFPNSTSLKQLMWSVTT